MTLAAELWKLRSLPTPKTVVSASFALVTVVSLIVFVVQPDSPDAYHQAPSVAASIAVFIGSIVFGAWVFGVEFNQGTMRRVLVAEPRRGIVLAVKTLVVAAGATLFAAMITGYAALASLLICAAATIDFDPSLAVNIVPSMTVQAALFALLACAFSLALRSYAGGVIGAFALILVADNLLALWQSIQDHTFSASTSAIDAAFHVGDSSSEIGLAEALIVALAWIAAVAVPGALRFVRGDFK